MKLSDKARDQMDKIVARFQAGDLSPLVEVITFAPDPDMPSATWSLLNRTIAYIQTGDLDVRGYRQWQATGRNVRKGERAAYILRPLMVKDADADDTNAARLAGFAATPVFGLSQTDGPDTPAIDYTPATPPPLSDVATAWGIDVTYCPIPGAAGSCSIDGTKIKLATGSVKVFFHELAHAAHSRLDTLKPGQDAAQETAAEFTACVLASLYGHDYTGNAWQYISGYNDDPLQAILKAITTVEKILHLITAAASPTGAIAA